jgi:hypothetical protein
MDSITMVAFELTPEASAGGGTTPLGGQATPAMFDISHFNAAYAAAGPAPAAAPQATPQVSAGESPSFRSVIATLTNLNGRADTLGLKALEMKGDELKPGEMLRMTMAAHEFLFHCELTSNVANRSSEGVQQLFREQV